MKKLEVKNELDYLVLQGFLRKIKEAIDSGIYPDKERGDQLVKTLEYKIKIYETNNEVK